MEKFRIDNWGKGYPGFYITFGSAEQLNTFITTLKKCDNESNLCAIYDMCVNMPIDQTHNTIHKENDYLDYDISVEKVEEKIFHGLVSRSWCPDCMVVDLNGTIKGDYHFFGRFTESGFYPAELGEILEKVARDCPEHDFEGIIYSDDGDHFSDTAEFSYKNKTIRINYKDDSGYWEKRPVIINI